MDKWKVQRVVGSHATSPTEKTEGREGRETCYRVVLWVYSVNLRNTCTDTEGGLPLEPLPPSLETT